MRLLPLSPCRAAWSVVRDRQEARMNAGFEDTVIAPSPPASAMDGPIRVDGKFFVTGAGRDSKKHFIKGVTYGPFGSGTHGAQFPETDAVERDFAMMVTGGI